MGDSIKDGTDVLTDFQSEEQWLVREFADTDKLQKKFADKDRRAEIVAQLIMSINQDEQRLINSHNALIAKTKDWEGDLKKEKPSQEIISRINAIEQLEAKSKNIFDASIKLCADVKNRFGNMTFNQVQSLDDKQVANIAPDIKALHDSFVNWINLEKELDKRINELNTFVKTFQATSKELNNYKNIKDKLNDLLKGEGQYKEYSKEDRKKILERYERSNGPIIQTRKYSVRYTFNNGLNSLGSEGFKRYLTPQEHFTIVMDLLNNSNRKEWITRYEDTALDMINGAEEWLSMAFNVNRNASAENSEGKFIKIDVYLNPVLKWDQDTRSYHEVSSGQHHGTFFIPKDKIHKINNTLSTEFFLIKDISDEVKRMIYGVYLNGLPEYISYARIYLSPKDGLWPVCCSYNNMNTKDQFFLYADQRDAAVRGMR